MHDPVPTPAPRVASLLPAATEFVAALGQFERLVGVSHECDHPPAARALPVLTRPRRDARCAVGSAPGSTAGSTAGSAQDAARAGDALSVFEVDLEALSRAAPDVILTQSLCEVCAVSRADVERAAALAAPGARIVDLAPRTLEDVWRDALAIGEALGVPDRARELVRERRERLDGLAARGRRLAHRPRVVTLEWLEPPMIGGLWMPELIEFAGGRALGAKRGVPAVALGRRELARLAPEIVLIKPCGFDLEHTFRDVDAWRDLLASLAWPALRSGDVFVADGNAFFNRPGPRLVESAEILAAVLHGADFGDLVERHAASFTRLARR